MIDKKPERVGHKLKKLRSHKWVENMKVSKTKWVQKAMTRFVASVKKTELISRLLKMMSASIGNNKVSSASQRTQKYQKTKKNYWGVVTYQLQSR